MWKVNKVCPECGKEIKDPNEFRCCEFGNSYCSQACAKKYVNENYKEVEDKTLEEDRCVLIVNAKKDPTWDDSLNARLCKGNCEGCPYHISEQYIKYQKERRSIKEITEFI